MTNKHYKNFAETKSEPIRNWLAGLKSVLLRAAGRDKISTPKDSAGRTPKELICRNKNRTPKDLSGRY